MNIVEYVLENRLKTFKDLPFSEVDALVLAQLAYYDYSMIDNGCYIKDFRKISDVTPITATKNLRELDERLFAAVINSNRFGDLYLSDFVSDFDMEEEKQFASISFYFDNKVIVAYRGTDGTIVGWKENFNMSFLPAVPSQIEAAEHLNKILDNKKVKEAIVVGHSKGGNLATYASARVSEELQNKIKTVYNFDGPGFGRFFYESLGYKNVANKLNKFIPQQSFVGRIMIDDKFTVVKSCDGQIMMQHWAYTWDVENAHFVYLPQTEGISNNIDLTIDDILEELSKNERSEIIDMFYEILKKNNCIYTDDILYNKDQILYFMKNYMDVEYKNRKKMTSFLWKLLFLFGKNFFVEKYNEAQNNKGKSRTEIAAEKKEMMTAYQYSKSSISDYMSRINKSK